MPLVSLAITPHSPVLIPSLGKENSIKANKTIESLGKIGDLLKEDKPDTLLFITPHGERLMKDSFTTLIGDPSDPETLQADFSCFGDFSIPFTTRCSDELIARIISMNAPFAINAVSAKNMDYGTAVPLSYIRTHLPAIKITTIGVSQQSEDIHIELGRALYNLIQESEEKISVICSIDLANTASETNAGIFDQTVLDLLAQGRIERIASINKTIVDESRSCAFRPLLVLSGLLEQIPSSYKLLSYENPFNVGYLCAYFTISKQ